MEGQKICEMSNDLELHQKSIWQHEKSISRDVSQRLRESVGPQNFSCKDSVLPSNAEMQPVCWVLAVDSTTVMQNLDAVYYI
jgi:hypothetical protein